MRVEDIISEKMSGAEIDLESIVKASGLYPYSSIHSVANDFALGQDVSHRSSLLLSDFAWAHTFVTQNAPFSVKQIQSEESHRSESKGISQDSADAERIFYVTNNNEMVENNSVVQAFEEKEVIDLINLEEVDVLEQYIKPTNDELAYIKVKKKSKKKKVNSFGLKDFSGLSSYSQWLLSLDDPNFSEKLEKSERRAKKKKLEAEAQKSIQKSDAIISESLADILALQGHIDDAKKMYAQLMIKYPEKSSYFASKIENL